MINLDHKIKCRKKKDTSSYWNKNIIVEVHKKLFKLNEKK